MSQWKFGILVVWTLFIFTGCAEDSSKSKNSRKHTTVSEENEADKPEYLACAIETCGKARSLPYLRAPIQEVDRNLYKDSIAPLLGQYVNLQTRSVYLRNQTLTRFSSMQIDRMSDAYLVFINLLYFYSFGEQVSKSLLTYNEGIRVDTMALKTALNQAGLKDSQQVNWIILIARTIFESDIFYENYYLSYFPLEIFIEKVYPGTETLKAIAKEAEKLQQIQQRVSEIYPIMKINSGSQNFIFQKAIGKEPLAPDEKKDFIENRMSLLTIQEILPGGRWRDFLLQRPVNAREAAADLLQKAKKSSLVKVDYKSLQKESEKEAGKCALFMTSNISSSPTADQNLKFLSLVQNLKNEARTVMERSGYNSAKVFQSINKISIMLPANKLETTAALARALQKEIDVILATQKQMQELNFNNQEDKEIVLLMLANLYQDYSNDEKPLDDIREFCEDHMPESISDASYSTYQKINIGWRSVLYPQYGYGIASHEMGHVISTADSSSSYTVLSRVKTCLQQNQNGQDKNVEEDFADLFATQMMKLKPQANYTCLLLAQENNQYTDLKLKAEKDSDHSSSFYRLLAVGTQINSLAPTCQAVKQSTPPGQRMKNCWGL